MLACCETCGERKRDRARKKKSERSAEVSVTFYRLDALFLFHETDTSTQYVECLIELCFSFILFTQKEVR